MVDSTTEAEDTETEVEVLQNCFYVDGSPTMKWSSNIPSSENDYDAVLSICTNFYGLIHPKHLTMLKTCDTFPYITANDEIQVHDTLQYIHLAHRYVVFEFLWHKYPADNYSEVFHKLRKYRPIEYLDDNIRRNKTIIADALKIIRAYYHPHGSGIQVRTTPNVALYFTDQMAQMGRTNARGHPILLRNNLLRPEYKGCLPFHGGLDYKLVDGAITGSGYGYGAGQIMQEHPVYETLVRLRMEVQGMLYVYRIDNVQSNVNKWLDSRDYMVCYYYLVTLLHQLDYIQHHCLGIWVELHTQSHFERFDPPQAQVYNYGYRICLNLRDIIASLNSGELCRNGLFNANGMGPTTYSVTMKTSESGKFWFRYATCFQPLKNGDAFNLEVLNTGFFQEFMEWNMSFFNAHIGDNHNLPIASSVKSVLERLMKLRSSALEMIPVNVNLTTGVTEEPRHSLDGDQGIQKEEFVAEQFGWVMQSSADNPNQDIADILKQGKIVRCEQMTKILSKKNFTNSHVAEASNTIVTHVLMITPMEDMDAVLQRNALTVHGCVRGGIQKEPPIYVYPYLKTPPEKKQGFNPAHYVDAPTFLLYAGIVDPSTSLRVKTIFPDLMKTLHYFSCALRENRNKMIFSRDVNDAWMDLRESFGVDSEAPLPVTAYVGNKQQIKLCEVACKKKKMSDDAPQTPPTGFSFANTSLLSGLFEPATSSSSSSSCSLMLLPDP